LGSALDVATISLFIRAIANAAWMLITAGSNARRLFPPRGGGPPVPLVLPSIQVMVLGQIDLALWHKNLH